MGHKYRNSDMIKWEDVKEVLGHWYVESVCKLCSERHSIAIVLLKDGRQKQLDTQLIDGWPY